MKLFNRIIAGILGLSLLLGFGQGLIRTAEAAQQMTASDACIEFIKEIEGFSKYPYFDYKQYTVGYGTRCPADKYEEYKGTGITKEAAEELLRQHIAKVEEELNKRILEKYDLTLSQNEFDALVSLSFNVGTGWVWGSQENCLKSVILGRAGDNALVYAFSLYSNAGGKISPGLVVRRLCEANLYLNGVYERRMDPAFGYVLYDAGEGSVVYSVQGFLTDAAAVPAADARQKDAAFLGWYTEPARGTRVTELTGELSGKTLYAQWQKDKPVSQEKEETAVTVQVTGDVVNLRKGPGTNYERIGRAYRGDTLTVSSVAEGTLLRWGQTPKGWICLDYTDYQKSPAVTQKPEETEPTIPETQPTLPSPTETVPEETVPAETLPQETTPEKEDSIPQTVYYGTVKASDGLRVRRGPGTGYALAGSLWDGDRVTITEIQTVKGVRWGKMELGWVCMDYIVLDSQMPEQEEAPTQPVEPETQPEAPAQPVRKGRVTADLLRVRSGPGTDHAILGFYGNQDEVVILEQALILGMYWGRTELGWVSMDYIEIIS